MKRLLILVALTAIFAVPGCSKKTVRSDAEPIATSTPAGSSGDTGNKGGDSEGTKSLQDFAYKDIYFETDAYGLDATSKDQLDRTSKYLSTSGNAVEVEGHCDERGSVEYNLALGNRRALSVKDYLVSSGVGGDRVSTISFGKERPADPGHDESAWAKNRRAHFNPRGR